MLSRLRGRCHRRASGAGLHRPERGAPRGGGGRTGPECTQGTRGPEAPKDFRPPRGPAALLADSLPETALPRALAAFDVRFSISLVRARSSCARGCAASSVTGTTQAQRSQIAIAVAYAIEQPHGIPAPPTAQVSVVLGDCIAPSRGSQQLPWLLVTSEGG
jgi:hypothetical protein